MNYACLGFDGSRRLEYGGGHCASEKFYWTTGDKNEVSHSCLDCVFELRRVCYMQHCKIFS